ncbi:MAG: radical SAM protein [Sulfolobaceae archaeon]
MKPLYLYAPAIKRYETEYLSSRHGWKIISVTGNNCAFNCKHCGRRILEGMIDGSTPQKFLRAIEGIKDGIILSGGSTARGEVPIWKYSSILKNYASKITIVAHTGVVRSLEIALKFKEAGVKIALSDMVGDDETIKEILGQPFTVEDYLNSLKYLKKVGIKVVPHIIVGLSRVNSELRALELLKEIEPDAVIIVGLMPLMGTELENYPPPSPDRMIEVLKRAREEFSVPIMLGCARPRGKDYIKVEKFAVDHEVDGIAFPAEEIFEYAKGKRKIVLSNACCANIVYDIMSR